MVVSVDGELECVIGESLYSGSRLKLVEGGVCRVTADGRKAVIAGILCTLTE